MKKLVSAYLEDDLIQQLKGEADRESRTDSQQIAYILKKYFEEKLHECNKNQ
jgi:hypothetical protein